MQRVAIISAVLDEPLRCQRAFNDTIAEYRYLVKGRMGVPMPDHDLALISIVTMGNKDDIDRLTNKLGRIDGVSVKTAMSQKEY